MVFNLACLVQSFIVRSLYFALQFSNAGKAENFETVDSRAPRLLNASLIPFRTEQRNREIRPTRLIAIIACNARYANQGNPQLSDLSFPILTS